ncbi:MAG: bifunctional diguanylate cyclase/phosphodiesterase [Rubrivivax sp.]|nr:bifunctional diguanylate cyclase/phosphodiesterase [Rubrivivax sp.]
MPASLQLAGYVTLPTALGTLLLVLALYMALELAHRAQNPKTRNERNAWLMAGAAAATCGILSAQVLNLVNVLGPSGVGFHAGLTLFTVLATLLLSAVAARWSFIADAGPPRALIGGAAFAAAALTGQALLVLSLGLLPDIQWNAAGLVLGWLVMAAGFAWALHRLPPRPDGAGFGFCRPQLVSSAMAAAAALIGQSLSVASASLPQSSPVDDPSLLSSVTMGTVASIGVAELLLLMLLACAFESRVRGKLDAVRGAVPGDAFRDSLTKLPSRNTFEGTLSQVLRQADATGKSAVLMHVALDRFKQVNDQCGHQTGDAVLKSVARRLRDLAPPHRAARLGGDEFLVLVDGDDAPDRAKTLAAAILEAMAQPCTVDGRELHVSCSIGMATYPQHGAQSVLITHAAVATRASKAGGGAAYSVFDPRMVNDVRDQAELLNDLRLALSHHQLELYYQPKIHAPSGQVTAAEALLRWHHPRRGMVSPSVFIPIAERSGLINALGAWVIDEACKQARIWRDQGLRMRVAVNLSAQQLRQADLPAHIAAALAKHQINPDLLTCEITESVAMEDTEATLRFFTDLAAVGVHISIDDFGSGYSSLAYLRKLPATELKIDRGFVLDLENSEGARKIAEAVVNLAQALNMKVVAEGEETDGQYQILRRLGYDQVQGFLFAKPMTATALALWASGCEGPRSIQFRESLFQETAMMAA